MVLQFSVMSLQMQSDHSSTCSDMQWAVVSQLPPISASLSIYSPCSIYSWLTLWLGFLPLKRRTSQEISKLSYQLLPPASFLIPLPKAWPMHVQDRESLVSKNWKVKLVSFEDILCRLCRPYLESIGPRRPERKRSRHALRRLQWCDHQGWTPLASSPRAATNHRTRMREHHRETHTHTHS